MTAKARKVSTWEVVDPVIVEVERLLDSGAKTIPSRLVKRLLRAHEQDSDAIFRFAEKLEDVIRRYGP